jgi:hypothetical protein
MGNSRGHTASEPVGGIQKRCPGVLSRVLSPDALRHPIRDHLSGTVIAESASSDLPESHRQAEPTCAHGGTRSSEDALSPWNDSLFNLAPSGVYQADQVTLASGELLPHRFTLTSPKPDQLNWSDFTGSAVYFLWHFP